MGAAFFFADPPPLATTVVSVNSSLPDATGSWIGDDEREMIVIYVSTCELPIGNQEGRLMSNKHTHVHDKTNADFPGSAMLLYDDGILKSMVVISTDSCKEVDSI